MRTSCLILFSFLMAFGTSAQESLASDNYLTETLFDVIEPAIDADMMKAITKSPVREVQFENYRLVGTYDECANCYAPFALRVAIFEDLKRKGRRLAVTVGEHVFCNPRSGRVYVVPDAFESDFLSIPTKPLRGVLRPTDFMRAAIIHDWLYAVGEEGMRNEADQTLKYVIQVTGAPFGVAHAIYQLVNLGGEKPYGDPREWRFRDAYSGEELRPPPFENRRVATVQTVETCDIFEDANLRRAAILEFRRQNGLAED